MAEPEKKMKSIILRWKWNRITSKAIKIMMIFFLIATVVAASAGSPTRDNSFLENLYGVFLIAMSGYLYAAGYHVSVTKSTLARWLAEVLLHELVKGKYGGTVLGIKGGIHQRLYQHNASFVESVWNNRMAGLSGTAIKYPYVINQYDLKVMIRIMYEHPESVPLIKTIIDLEQFARDNFSRREKRLHKAWKKSHEDIDETNLNTHLFTERLRGRRSGLFS